MSSPKFSVIIPAYNAEETLRSTAASVLNQSETDLELIIVDDGSTDETLNLMLEVASRDLRVRAISRQNGGVSSARNLGAELARGEFLAFLDADDRWHREKLATHREHHRQAPGLDASFAEVTFWDEGASPSTAMPTTTLVGQRDYSVSDLIVENPVCTTSNLVIRRENFDLLGGFDTSMRYAEDQDFLVRLIGHGHRLGGIDVPLVRYRLSIDGLSCDFDAMLASWREIASRWLNDTEFKKAEAAYCRYLARRALRSGAPISVAHSFACKGLAADLRGFFGNRKRQGFLILGGIFAGTVMPASMRRNIFA
ncbi:MAG: glycosyltransferase [Erythrobacter sp.]